MTQRRCRHTDAQRRTWVANSLRLEPKASVAVSLVTYRHSNTSTQLNSAAVVLSTCVLVSQLHMLASAAAAAAA